MGGTKLSNIINVEPDLGFIEELTATGGESVKLKLRTPKTLYTMKVVGDRAEEIIKGLACEVVEV